MFVMTNNNFESESREDRRKLHEEVQKMNDANSRAHEDLHNKIDALAESVREMKDMLVIGKAGIAFVKFISIIGSSIALGWAALIEIGKTHKP